MPKQAETMARRLVRAIQSRTDGNAQQWLPVETAARLLVLKDDPRLEAALEVGVNRGWLIIEGGHSVCLTVNSRPTVTPFSRPIMTPLGGQEWAYPGSAQEGPAPVAQRPWRCAQRRAWEVPVYPRG